MSPAAEKLHQFRAEYLLLPLLHEPEEVLLPGALRLVDRARAAGVDAHLEIFPHMWHVWHMFLRAMPEAKAAIARIATFMQDKL